MVTISDVSHLFLKEVCYWLTIVISLLHVLSLQEKCFWFLTIHQSPVTGDRANACSPYMHISVMHILLYA